MRRAVAKYGCELLQFILDVTTKEINSHFHFNALTEYDRTEKRACMVEINCTERPTFINYASGVFADVDGATLHAMAIVGYGNYNGTDMWIVRNSWSPNWGMGV